ncbi:MAG: S-layer homology domain-containing protein [Clostridia bacterium]|nr:S-layer homology domain-containing protein [Clostridia bacterium]
MTRKAAPFIIITAFVLVFTLLSAALPAAAAFSDVPGDSAFAEAVDYVRGRGLMVGTSSDRFSPDSTFTRAQMATVIYRLAGEPGVSGDDGFYDTDSGMWYSSAVLWASENGIVKGYGNGKFGTGDPVTQEQLLALLYRLEGEPEVSSGTEAPEGTSGYAVNAVAWALSCGIVSESDGYVFSPGSAAARAVVASVIWRYDMLKGGSGETPQPKNDVLVVYFSATGHTRPVAGYIAEILGADIFEILPEIPYTGEDLNYSDSGTRATREQNDPSARPGISGLPDVSGYRRIFIGYPIWWGQAPKIMYTFVESVDLGDAVIIPFCTSGSSPIGTSAVNLRACAEGGKWEDGRRFAAGTSYYAVEEWLRGPEMTAAEAAAADTEAYEPRGTGDGTVHDTETAQQEDPGKGDDTDMTLRLYINGSPVKVKWESNASARALRELAGRGSVVISMSRYGGFEQVGSIGKSIASSDVRMTTSPGDIVLYSSSNIVIFYGSNTWEYTKLGKIEGYSEGDLRDILGNEDAEIVISLE